MRSSMIGSGLVLAAVVLVVCVASGRQRSAARSLLDGDWRALAESAGDSPADGVLRAHALLLTNRNAESTRLLLDLGDEDRAAWDRWTAELVAAHPDRALAWFARGDALARGSDPARALAAFDQALALDASCAPATLGRGVVLAALGRDGECEAAFQRLCDLVPELAEAHASLGVFRLAHRAPLGAERSFRRALELAPGHVLARNGLACALWARGEVARAAQAFEQAAEVLPLALVAGNLRALCVEQEGLALDLPQDSPLLRHTDFLDWAALRARSAAPEDLMRAMNGGELPEQLDVAVLARLNAALGEAELAHRAGREAPAECSSQDALARNRALLEGVYPDLIAKRSEREPGMQLTLHGFVDSARYREQLSGEQLLVGQWTLDHVTRPFANALESSRVPVASFIGKELNAHAKLATAANAREWERRGHDAAALQPGGVETEPRERREDRGEGPFVAWYGLLQTAPRSPAEFFACAPR